jgi:hypothetical protein
MGMSQNDWGIMGCAPQTYLRVTACFERLFKDGGRDTPEPEAEHLPLEPIHNLPACIFIL